MSRIVLCCLLLLFISASGQDPLTNDAIIKLVKSGISENVVVDMVNHRPGKYALGVDDVIGLKQAGVPDKIIAAVIAKDRPRAAVTPGASEMAPSLAASGGSLQELDVGVYIQRQDKLVDVAPEIVTWRTGGILKRVATVGVIKTDVNGVIQNSRSRLQLSTPVEFIVRCPEGTQASEYQLLRLHEKGTRREFRIATGGIIHASGGVERNAVPFQFEKIADRTYRVKVDTLKKGEYGFLPPGAYTAASSVSMGKVYAFGVE